jgi:hypothetical protein
MLCYWFIQNSGSSDLQAFHVASSSPSGGPPCVGDIVAALPLRGAMHLRFMVSSDCGGAAEGETSLTFQWLDLVDPTAAVPIASCGGAIVKVLALGDLEVVDRSAAAPTAAAAAAASPRKRPQPLVIFVFLSIV